MPKYSYKQHEVKNKVIKNDIEFNFSDVQGKNPKMSGRTPMWLFTPDPLKKHRGTIEHWWDKTR